MRITDLTERRIFVRIVEFFPPSASANPKSGGAGFDLRTRVQSLIDKARRVENLSDAVIIAQPKDSSRFHVPSLLAAVEVKKSTGIEAIPTIPLRDYNRYSFRGLVLYGIYAGLDNVCLVRGDPFLRDELGYSGNVYDLRRVAEAARIVKEMLKLAYNARVCVLGPLDLSEKLDEEYVEMIRERQANGVDAFICQPFFGSIEDCLERIDKLRAGNISRPIIHNVFPLKGAEDATKMEQKFGWHVDKQVLLKLKDRGAEAGLSLARERCLSLSQHRSKVDGVYISSRGNADWAVTILT